MSREENKNCKTRLFLKTILLKTFMTVPTCTIDMVETRTIYEQLKLKLCKNLRTARLGKKLLVPIKKRAKIFQKIVYDQLLFYL